MGSLASADMLLHLDFCVRRCRSCQSFVTARLHYGGCFRVQDARNAILKALDRLGVHPDDQVDCIDIMVRKARQVCVNNMRKADYRGKRVLHTFDLSHRHHVGERRESVEDQDYGMVPAALPAIRALGAKRIEVEDGKEVGECMVCLEEYSNAEKVTCMPCSHMFHRDCITKWLLKSHVCPICKFEMPKYSVV